MPTLVKFKSRNRSVVPSFVPAPANDSLRRPLPDAKYRRILLFGLGEAILPSRPQIDAAVVPSGGQGWPPTWRPPAGLVLDGRSTRWQAGLGGVGGGVDLSRSGGSGD